MDVADVREQPGGAGGADPVQLQQGRPALGHQRGEFLLDGLDPLVDALELDDQLDREPAAGLPNEVAGFDGRDHRPGLLRGQERLRAAREQFQQKPMQPVDRLGPGPPELIAAVNEHPHHHQVGFDLHPDQPG